DGKAQFLFAAQVPFRRLDRDMSKEKLDLVQLATGKMAEPRATAAKIMRCEFFNSGARCGCSDDFPQHLGRHASSPDPSGLVDPVLLIDRKSAPSVVRPASFHSSIATFTHDGIGTVRMCPALPRRSAITQCSSRDWMQSTRRASNSPRRNPHPTSIAIM